MSGPDETPVERDGYRVIQQWRLDGKWHAEQDDYVTAKEAWLEFHAATEAMSDKGEDAQVDLYDLRKRAVLETWRPGRTPGEQTYIGPDRIRELLTTMRRPVP